MTDESEFDWGALDRGVRRDPPGRPKDRFYATVAEWTGGCVKCGQPVAQETLPDSDGRLRMPLCRRHVRWAMASRREGVGKQAGALRRLLLAWCDVHGEDAALAKDWLERGRQAKRVRRDPREPRD